MIYVLEETEGQFEYDSSMTTVVAVLSGEKHPNVWMEEYGQVLAAETAARKAKNKRARAAYFSPFDFAHWLAENKGYELMEFEALEY